MSDDIGENEAQKAQKTKRRSTIIREERVVA